MNEDTLARFRELGVATVYEASGREGLIDVPLIQLLPGSRVAGPVRTALCGAALASEVTLQSGAP